jgi:phosphoribosylamine--glycine ligase
MKMQILIVGGGGREHALAWKIAQSPLVTKIYCAPGNPGMEPLAECVSIAPNDIESLAKFAAANQIALTVVGPEAPLIAGIVDVFEARGLPIFGPSSEPARLEGSKAFAKEIMRTSGIPTAAFWVCDSRAAARTCLRNYYSNHSPDTKIVIKADGLAAGKGVTVAENEVDAQAALERMMGERVFGASGDRVVIEECLIGEEASIMAITDGNTIVPLVPSQDHKRVFEGDLGPNTGGMGAYSPVPVIPTDTAQLAVERILKPAVTAIRALGIPYRGVLYAGIIVTADGPKCIEFNCRLGDPETQVVLPLLESDLVPLLLAVTDCNLDQAEARWRHGAAATVVAASGGYPGDFAKGKPITGIEQAEAEECIVFQAGTRLEEGQVVTDGGRVLSVTGLGETLQSALARAYAGLDCIRFEGMHYRRDIGARALKREAGIARH